MKLYTTGSALFLALATILLAASAPATAAEQERGRFAVGLKGGYNTFYAPPFDKVNVNIYKSSNFIGGAEFAYEVKPNNFLTLSIDYFDAADDSEIELSFIPVSLTMRSNFQTAFPFRPYVLGGLAAYFMSDEVGEVKDPLFSDAEITNIDEAELIDREGDKWFSQAVGLGFHVGVGGQWNPTEDLGLFLQVEGRSFFSSRRWTNFHYPVFIGARYRF